MNFNALSLIYFSTFVFILSGCSRINQPARDYYETKHMRHGIIPLTSSIIKKLDEASVNRGKVLYQKHCLQCHGANADGNGAFAAKDTKPSNLRKLAEEVRDFKFFISISQWKGDMPGWQEPMDEIAREDLSAYIKSLRYQ